MKIPWIELTVNDLSEAMDTTMEKSLFRSLYRYGIITLPHHNLDNEYVDVTVDHDEAMDTMENTLQETTMNIDSLQV